MAESSETQRKNSQRQKKGGPGKPWSPGQSGNPGGRPKGFAALIRERTEEGLPLVDYAVRLQQGLEVDLPEDATVKERVEVARLRLDAGKWLADRGWGQPTQSVEHSGPEGEALVVQVLTYAGTVSQDDK
jgi:hypothetical protein